MASLDGAVAAAVPRLALGVGQMRLGLDTSGHFTIAALAVYGYRLGRILIAYGLTLTLRQG